MPPKNITARPTTDFAKESLFNLLVNRMEFDNVDMLDLFAGTGGIGLEFISRGAREVTAVEMAHTQQNFIISCCKQLGIRNLHSNKHYKKQYKSRCNQIEQSFSYLSIQYYGHLFHYHQPFCLTTK